VSDVRISFDDGFVASVTIERPPDNYFDAALIGDIADAYESLDADERCRAIVLRSEGKNFCAGASLGGDVAGGVRGGSNASGRHLYEEAVRMFAGRTPVVAAVQGAAVGGGLGLALAADFRVGTPNTRCSANFARLGFHHGFGLSITLPLVVGHQRALELLYTGARLNGEAAHAIGLLDRLVAVDELDAATTAFAREIAGSGPLAVPSIRETMRGDLPERIRAATDRERAEQDRLSTTADFAEGVRAMAERRPPDFRGR
jgi:2-(1,2-epoxy-1,2-dihydrophenyl)acetyl-CoA isomerase